MRGYEPRGGEFESLRALQIDGINNDTNSMLSQVTDKTWTYQDIVVQLVNGTPGRVVCIRVAICCWLGQTHVSASL